MKKLLVLLGVTLLAGCNVPSLSSEEEAPDAPLITPIEDATVLEDAMIEEQIVEPAAEEAVIEEEAEAEVAL